MNKNLDGNEKKELEKNKKLCGTCKKLDSKLHSKSQDTSTRVETTKENREKESLFKRFFRNIFLGLGLISEQKDDEGFNPHGDEEGGFEVKTWILVIALTLTLVAFSAMIWGSFVGGLDNVPIIGKIEVQFSLATIMFILTGIAFIKASTESLINKTIAEDTLVAIATTSAYITSIFAWGFGWGFSLFYEAIEIWGLIYFGRSMESWLTNKVTKNIAQLESLKPKNAIIIRNGIEENIDINELKLGDILVIKPGSVVPVDGIVVEGQTTIDESSLTGESLPILKKIDSTVFGGTISSDGLIKIKATKLIGDSFISRIIKGVSDATEAKPKAQRIADKIASYLVPIVLIIAIITLVSWGAFIEFGNSSKTWVDAIKPTMTVLVIACPCSFALITPMTVLAASATSKKEGVLFNSKNIFEIVKEINIIAFDKTGTLTEGKFKVVNSTVPEKYIPLVLAGEVKSNHPLATSIVTHFKGNDKIIDEYSIEVVGKGIEMNEINIGSFKWVKEFMPEYIEEQTIIDKRKNGSVIIYVFNKKKIHGYIELRDEIKETALETLSALRKMEIDVVMITGDQKVTALSIASKLGIREENVYYEVDPTDKAMIIKEIQEKGNKVAFVGDGINDSVALTQAELGIAMGEGSDAAIESSDIVLNINDLNLVAYAMGLSRKTLWTVKRGFGLAIAYNVLTVPLAATGIIPPAIGALIMIMNDSVAMINAMTLYGYNRNSFSKTLNKK